ncbi:hypothetical protein PF001_g20356 [Phytophthora fragariae]|uniref:Uncharacterized protein n=1 Tax=Phytophthora fragariae TaxID=53985 RepID=A0A6A4CLU8_9STRA|nr:hypothetical protein PF006_g5402 [Phytophthora fragariae]KAE9288773.1 hypothetical protein PF001_g20356 [Phytophthora fragariae]
MSAEVCELVAAMTNVDPTKWISLSRVLKTAKEQSMLQLVRSLIGCFYVVGTYWRVLALRQHAAGIMFGMSLYGAIYQFSFLLDQASTSVQCSDMGILVDFFLTGQETYMLISPSTCCWR